MKCINCYREIADGLKFCPKCGFIQPEDRVAYELEHPELADAVPEDEILEQVNMLAQVPRTAMSRDEFVQLVATDPQGDNIVNIVDDGLATYGLAEPSAVEAWYAKCAELIGDKQGFYPYFVKLLSQQPEKARNLLHSQVADDMNLALPQQGPSAQYYAPIMPDNGNIYPEIPQPPAPPMSAFNPPLPEVPQMQTAPLETTPLTPVSPLQEKTVECPICHQQIAFGVRQCPYCRQLLDWSYLPDEGENLPDGRKPKRGMMWTILAIVMTVLIGCAGYYIYSSVKNKAHISKNEKDDYGPTGDMNEDAERYVNEVLELMEDADISSREDYYEYQDDVDKLEKEYKDYYDDLGDGRWEVFIDKCYNLVRYDSDLNRRYEKARRRIEKLRERYD